VSTEVSVRPAELRDVDSIADIHVRAWEHYYTGILPDEVIKERTPEVRRRSWREKLSNLPPGEIVLVAEVDGDVVGFVGGVPSWYDDQDPKRVINLNVIYLDPERQGKGVGAALYDAFARRAVEMGYEEVEGQIDGENELSWRFFVEQRGWQPDGYQRERAGRIERRVRGPLTAQPGR
jgi:L-amino acid N-acyltransferase YncA